MVSTNASFHSENEMDNESCSLCDTKFQENKWSFIGGYQQRTATDKIVKLTRYRCPTDDCDGEIRVYGEM